MDKTLLTAADLFVLLDREFRRRKARECLQCFVALPYRVDCYGDEAHNWELVTPEPCEWRCSDVIDDLVGEYRARYRLVAETRSRLH